MDDWMIAAKSREFSVFKAPTSQFGLDPDRLYEVMPPLPEPDLKFHCFFTYDRIIMVVLQRSSMNAFVREFLTNMPSLRYEVYRMTPETGVPPEIKCYLEDTYIPYYDDCGYLPDPDDPDAYN